MSKFLTLISIFFFACQLYGQRISEDEILGSWSVKRITQKPTNPDMEPILAGFSQGTFKFHSVGDFEFTTSFESELFEEVVEMLRNTKWKFDHTEQLIRIGGEEDGFTVMGIYINKVSESLHFQIDEGGLKFEMTRTK